MSGCSSPAFDGRGCPAATSPRLHSRRSQPHARTGSQRRAAQLDVYGGALSQLESSLKGLASCSRPAIPPTIQMAGMAAGGSRLSGADYYDPGDTNNHPHEIVGRAHLGMIKAAFLCDITRVATFMWSAGTNWVVFPAIFNGAIGPAGETAQPHHPISHDTYPATTAWLAQIDRWYAQQTAAFLQELDSTARHRRQLAPRQHGGRST